MSLIGLSNLAVRSNLLSKNYPRELDRITAVELKNVEDRLPLLSIRPTGEQNQQLKEMQFWGDRDRRVSLEKDDRRRAWVESLSENIEHALEELDEKPTLEDAIELLVVTSQLRRADLDSHHRIKASDWERRVRAILARDEFRFSAALVDQRLAEILDATIPEIQLPSPSRASVHRRSARSEHSIKPVRPG